METEKQCTSSTIHIKIKICSGNEAKIIIYFDGIVDHIQKYFTYTFTTERLTQ